MNILTQVLLPLVLAFIMFSMGLSLTVKDFKAVAKYPKAFAIGTVLQMVTLPLLAFAVASLWTEYFALDPLFAVGLVVIAACPGGVTSNLMTHLAKGDTALSISLTGFISFLSVLTLPLLVNLGLSTFLKYEDQVQLDVGKSVLGIFAITSLPVILGMAVKAKKEALADRFEPLCRNLATIFFVVVVLAAMIKDWSTLANSYQIIGPSTLTLNLLTMMIAYGVSRFFLLSKEQSRAITFECGLQNGTLAIYITVTLLGDGKMVLPAIIYGILMFITGGGYLAKLMLAERSRPAVT